MIVVTGASRGLGKAICERLVSSGKKVIGLARTPSDNNGYHIIACDVSKPDDVKRAAQEIKQKLKEEGTPMEALVNVAGIASMNLALTTPPEMTKNIIETNLLGTIYCCQQFAPLMVRAKSGSIINFSTIAVALGLKGESVYIASKAGVEGFSRAFAREMGDFNIRVNCIAPGPIDTDLIRGVNKNQIAQLVNDQIITHQFTPDVICDLVEMLMNAKSASLTGHVLHVGGV